MTTRRTSQILVLLVGLFGVLAFVCACRSAKDSEFPKLTEPEKQAFELLNQ